MDGDVETHCTASYIVGLFWKPNKVEARVDTEGNRFKSHLPRDSLCHRGDCMGIVDVVVDGIDGIETTHHHRIIIVQ